MEDCTFSIHCFIHKCYNKDPMRMAFTSCDIINVMIDDGQLMHNDSILVFNIYNGKVYPVSVFNKSYEILYYDDDFMDYVWTCCLDTINKHNALYNVITINDKLLTYTKQEMTKCSNPSDAVELSKLVNGNLQLQPKLITLSTKNIEAEDNEDKGTDEEHVCPFKRDLVEQLKEEYGNDNINVLINSPEDVVLSRARDLRQMKAKKAKHKKKAKHHSK